MSVMFVVGRMTLRKQNINFKTHSHADHVVNDIIHDDRSVNKTNGEDTCTIINRLIMTHTQTPL